MKVIVAKTAGFCFGVNRAVKLAEDASKQYSGCVTLGPIIHNKNVVSHLRSIGVDEISSASEASKDNTVIIRSHGIGRDEYDTLRNTGANIIDATCPDVAKIHRRVREESENGRFVIIVGERAHPEVLAISNWCGDCAVIENPQEAERLIRMLP